MAGTPVPLLAPDTLYTVTVAYDVLDTEPGSSTPIPTNNTQAYQFHTDNQPPAKLDPYVLCSSPAQGEQFVFYEDPLDILFNDNSVFSLFEAYGYQLSFVCMRPTGCRRLPGGALLTDRHRRCRRSTASARPCTTRCCSWPGNCRAWPPSSQYQNQLYTAPVYLRPLMGYTFDLVTDPVPPANPSSPPAAVTPLFRRNFSTGRYANLQALAQRLGRTQRSRTAR